MSVKAICSGWFKKPQWPEYSKALRVCGMRGWTLAVDADRIQRELNRVGVKLRLTAKGGDAA